MIRQVDASARGAAQTRLLVALARAEAEADAVAVAEVAAVDPLVGHAAALVGGVVLIAAADLAAVGLPQPVNDQPGTGQDRGAVGQGHRAECLAGERACIRRPAYPHADQFPAGFLPR